MKTPTWLSIFSADFRANPDGTPAVARIEIPMIQRDYAQGRNVDRVPTIRRDFLRVLHEALTSPTDSVTLDFVYGSLTDGKLTPLDGQQRLTTLFLLHWYVAVCEGVSPADAEALTKFTYETRPSARAFCRELAKARPEIGQKAVSEWLKDQPWFFSSWRHDATISAMLVILDEIQLLFGNCGGLWARLSDQLSPAISFHFLPIEGMGLTDDIYVKMNSRGKPLTDFENFKARFEQVLQAASKGDHQRFIDSIDNAWTDLLWRGPGSVIDGQFLRYFRFVTQILQLRARQVGKAMENSPTELIDLAEEVYGAGNPASADNRRYLFDALDCWCARDSDQDHKYGARVDALFNGLFWKDVRTAGAVRLFDSPVGLFQACCNDFGTKKFTIADALLLALVVDYLVAKQRNGDAAQAIRVPGPALTLRLRIARNLVVNSSSEIREDNLPGLYRDVAKLAATGTIEGLEAFNKHQAAQEKQKLRLRESDSDLGQWLSDLEDHDLLRGDLSVFDLQAAQFRQRAATFADVFSGASVPWRAVSAALLACGDYSQTRSAGRRQFGSPSSAGVWHDLFTAYARSDFSETSRVLAVLLDRMSASGPGTIETSLEVIAEQYLAECMQAGAFNWRYYFVKYGAMRAGESGIYYWYSESDIAMLDATRIHSWHRDPYVSAVHQASKLARSTGGEPWFRGGPSRLLRLEKVGVAVMPIGDGFMLVELAGRELGPAHRQVCVAHGIRDRKLQVPRVVKDGAEYDQVDRIQLASELVDALLKA